MQNIKYRTMSLLRKAFLILFTFLIFWNCSGQINISGQINNYPKNEKIYLSSYFGEQISPIDSCKSTENGSFQFILPKNTRSGLYRVDLGKGRFFDLIIHQEKKIDLIIDWNAPQESLEVIKSNENALFYSYMREETRIETAISLLFPLLDDYPRSDPFFKDIALHYDFLEREKDSLIRILSKKAPETFASKLIAMRKSPTLQAWMPKREKLETLKNEFFYGLDFSDTNLLYSNAYTSKAIEYLSFYSNPDYSFEEIQLAFMTAVDKIMAKASENPKVYNQILNYLVHGFEQYHFDEVLAHIASQWPEDGTCHKEDEGSLSERLKNYQKLANGMPAPDIDFIVLKGGNEKLSEIKSKNTLLVFWASWCPHCKHMMPSLKELYKNTERDELEIIALSIDTSQTQWKAAIDELDLPWKNACDQKGWDGDAALKYNIYATPSFFLLDEQKNIISKPMSVGEIRKKINAGK